MKTIELKKTNETVVIGGKEIDMDISTVELLRSAINSPVEGGFTIQDMATRIKLLDAVKSNESNESLSLEDSDFAYLSNLVKTTKWNVLSNFIIDFSKQFN